MRMCKAINKNYIFAFEKDLRYDLATLKLIHIHNNILNKSTQLSLNVIIFFKGKKKKKKALLHSNLDVQISFIDLMSSSSELKKHANSIHSAFC